MIRRKRKEMFSYSLKAVILIQHGFEKEKAYEIVKAINILNFGELHKLSMALKEIKNGCLI